MRHLVPTVYEIVIRYIFVILIHLLGTATSKLYNGFNMYVCMDGCIQPCCENPISM